MIGTALVLLGAALAVLAVAGPRLLARGDLTLLITGLDDTPHRLADAILFVHADLEAGHLAVLSVPRDTMVTGPDGQRRLANAVVTQDGGVEKLAAELHLIVPQERVTMTAGYVSRLIDAVGGVEVDVGPHPLNYYDRAGNWHIHLKPGRQRLTGSQAFYYARFRKSRPGPCPLCGATWPVPARSEMTDLVRIGRQQQLLRGLLREVRTARVAWRAPRVLSAARQADSTLGLLQVLALAGCLHRARKPEFETYPTQVVRDLLLPVPDAAGRRLGEDAAALLADRVIVRNGAGAPGLAARVTARLSRKGFIVASPENAPRTRYTLIEGPRERSEQVREALGYGRWKERNSSHVTVTLGLDAPGSG